MDPLFRAVGGSASLGLLMAKSKMRESHGRGGVTKPKSKEKKRKVELLCGGARARVRDGL